MSERAKSGHAWVIQGQFRIEAADEYDAQRVLDRIERCARAIGSLASTRTTAFALSYSGSEEAEL